MENKVYTYVQNKLNNSGAVKIISGDYIGLIVDFGKVMFNEDENSDKMHMSFEYNVHNHPDNHEEGWEDGVLIDFLGEVLVDILENKITDDTLSDFLGETDVDDNKPQNVTFQYENINNEEE